MPRGNAVKKDAQPAAQAEPVKTTKAVNRPPRSLRKALESNEQTVGQDKARAMKSTGNARESLDAAEVQPVDRVVSKDKLEALQFNEDILTVMVHETTNPIDDPMPEVWNDGKVQRFQRGVEMQVKRKYVEVLARAKKTTYTQRKEKDGNGDEKYINVPHTALKYPFSVLHDPSPRGRDWLKNVLAEA